MAVASLTLLQFCFGRSCITLEITKPQRLSEVETDQLSAGEMVFDVVVAALRDSENDSESACFHTLYSPLWVDVENYSMVFIFKA